MNDPRVTGHADDAYGKGNDPRRMTDAEPSQPSHRAARPGSEVDRGREDFRRRSWAGAYEALSRADQMTPLGPDDLELLAMSAYLTGRDDDYLSALERAHHAHLSVDAAERAVRCAFWLGLRLASRGENGRANGWLARARRSLEHAGRDCAEHGYLLLPTAQQQLDAGDCAAAHATAAQAAEIGNRFGEVDLIACARHLQGRALMQHGQIAPGLALLDEVMVVVARGNLSPLVTGLIYCSVIEGCQEVFALDRSREWTSALGQWCEEQPEMVAFSGVCRVHRAEILQMRGEWSQAIDEARGAHARSHRAGNASAVAAALYQQGEVHRLRGDFAPAEKAYRDASRAGQDPQPGLALMRLAQGRRGVAAAGIRRAAGGVTDRLQRVRLLPAFIEVLLAAGDIEDARGASFELEEIAQSVRTAPLDAMAAHGRGAVELAEGDIATSLASLRRAWTVWHRVEAPYPAARVRVLVGLACRELGDDEGFGLELDAARAAFAHLGALPDLARVDALIRGATTERRDRVTARERQVLRLVAVGKTNRAIADELFLSEKTVDRHVSNILAKLDVPSRSAATAYAYTHDLV